MKAEELMIGDWVHCITDDVYYKIDCLNIGDRYIADPGLYERESNDVEGIPITEEILLLNDMEASSIEQNTNEKFWLSPYSSFSIVQCGHEFWLCGYQICIKYVHQLQQALRLAGLFEYANNFKI